MRDHMLGYQPLAHLIADAHEPERKPMRTPERQRLTYDQEVLRAGHDRRTTKQLPAPMPAPVVSELRRVGMLPDLAAPYGVDPTDGCDVDHAIDSISYSCEAVRQAMTSKATFDGRMSSTAWSDSLYTDGSTLSILANPKVQAILAPTETTRPYRNGIELIDGHVYEIEMESTYLDGKTTAFTRWENGAFQTVSPDEWVARGNNGFSEWLNEDSRRHRPFTVLRDVDAEVEP